MGRKVKGMPVCTIMRGTVIAEEGEVIGKPGNGQFVKRLSQ
jgi:allantoinase